MAGLFTSEDHLNGLAEGVAVGRNAGINIGYNDGYNNGYRDAQYEGNQALRAKQEALDSWEEAALEWEAAAGRLKKQLERAIKERDSLAADNKQLRQIIDGKAGTEAQLLKRIEEEQIFRNKSLLMYDCLFGARNALYDACDLPKDQKNKISREGFQKNYRKCTVRWLAGGFIKAPLHQDPEFLNKEKNKFFYDDFALDMQGYEDTPAEKAKEKTAG